MLLLSGDYCLEIVNFHSKQRDMVSPLQMPLPFNFNTSYRRMMLIRESYFNRGQLRMHHHMCVADMSRLYNLATSQSLDM